MLFGLLSEIDGSWANFMPLRHVNAVFGKEGGESDLNVPIHQWFPSEMPCHSF